MSKITAHSLQHVALAAAVALFGTGLVGCAELKKLDDAAMAHALAIDGRTGEMQPSPEMFPTVKVPAATNCRFNRDYPESANCCVMDRYATRPGIDVDTAYARAMQEFSFTERMPTIANKYEYARQGHLHQKTPGSLYRLYGEVRPRSDVTLGRGVWIGLMIAKTSPTSAEVEPTYCEIRSRPMSDQLAWHQAVQRAILTALPPAAPSVTAAR